MDVDKCVALHNKIMEIGWSGSERSIPFEETCKSWFEFHGDEAEAMRAIFSPDLTAFLERAYKGHTHSFTYYVSALSCPHEILAGAEIFNHIFSEDVKPRFIVLYFMSGGFASHPVGLVFDQHNASAIMCECIDDADIICNNRIKWHPLETVLEAWLDMIEKGKFVFTNDSDGKEPWKLAAFSEQILQECVNVFNSLVDEIESRLPQDDTPRGDALPPLIEDGILDTLGISQGFAGQFARRAKRPRFRFIAPGLAAPDTESFRKQPFASLASSGENKAFPILLFGAIDNATKCMAPQSLSEDESPFDRPFGGPFGQVEKYPAGLYFSCDSPRYDRQSEDECVLVLPYCIGARGYARTSDGARFGENLMSETEEDGRDSFIDLYQLGYNHFITGHTRQLLDILKNWRAMIREGHWKVDADGVMGGIEEWRKADTKEDWEKYVIPITW